TEFMPVLAAAKSANWLLKRPATVLNQTPVEFGERAFVLQCNGVPIVTDPRAAVKQFLKMRALDCWKESKTQSALACLEAKEAFEAIARLKPFPGATPFTMRILTDTLRFI